MRNHNQAQMKYWADDMYHKSEMREFAKLQLKLSEKNNIDVIKLSEKNHIDVIKLSQKNQRTMIIAAIISGLLIGGLPDFVYDHYKANQTETNVRK